MSKTQDIQTGIWVNDDFVALSPEAKLLYFWCVTNPENNMAGVYSAGRAAMAAQTLMGAELVMRACEELEEKRFVFFDGDWLYIRSRVRHLRQKGKLTAKGIVNSISRMDRKNPLRVAFLFEYENEDWLTEYLWPLMVNEGADPDLAHAVEWLQAFLVSGPASVRSIMEAASETGISQPVLRRAKSELSIESCQQMDGWWWLLPQRRDDQISEDHGAESDAKPLQAPSDAPNYRDRDRARARDGE